MNTNEIFKYVPSIWVGEREYMWFQKAWEILGKNNMTSYDNFVEHGKVALRAMTLAMIYIDFCKITLDESHWYEDILETFKDDIIGTDEGDMGFLYARLSEEEVYPGFEEAVLELTDAERPKILKVLHREMNNAKICLGMYCTAIDEDSYLCCGEEYYEDDEDFNENDILLNIKSYDSYWNSIDKNFHEIIDAEFDNLMMGYEWLEDGAYRITNLD